MSDNNPSDVDPFGAIADQFVEAFRQGQRPSVEEFARRYPEHADEIRDLLPALALMEKAKSGDDPSGQRRQVKAAVAAVPLQQLGDYQILREVGRGAAWASSTRRSNAPSAGTWPSRCCRPMPCSTRGS